MVALSGAAHGLTLFDVRFSSPPDVVGNPAVVSGNLIPTTPQSLPTDQILGTSRVLASSGSLVDQPLLLIPEAPGNSSLDFNTGFSVFNLPPSGPGIYWEMSFDLILDNF